VSNLTDITFYIQQLVFPFAEPDKNTQFDWHERISLLTSLNELLIRSSSESALYVVEPVKDEAIDLNKVKSFITGFNGNEMQTKSNLLDISDYQPLLDYAKTSKVTFKNNEQMIKMFTRIISIERLAISTCSLAIMRYSLPIPVLIEFVNIIRDECLHLIGFSRLLGVNPLGDDWITSQNMPCFEQLLKCDTPLEHVVLEHCLFETEGSFSANYAVHVSQGMGLPESAISVVERVAIEENRHSTLGYYMASLLCNTAEERQNAIVKCLSLIREIEPLDSENMVKLYKQTVAVKILQTYAISGNWLEAIKIINLCAENAKLGILYPV
jgi:hypothetical protein